MENSMFSDLKRLVLEFEKILIQRSNSLDAPARDAFVTQINDLIRRVDEAEADEASRIKTDSLNLLAALLSVITNVMSFLK